MVLRAKLVSKRTSFAHATVVADDDHCHFFFSHLCKKERGQEKTTVDIFLIGYAWIQNVHYGTRRSVHEATNFW